jgi:VanZ family protein
VNYLRSPHLYAGLWVAIVAALMMMPAAALPEFESWLPLNLEQWIDKVQHILAFMVMVVLMARSMSEMKTVQRPVLAAAVLTLGISFALEALQILVPWRHFDVADLVADAVGVSMAVPFARQAVERMKLRRIHR